MNQLSLLAFGAGGWGDEILRGLAVTLALALATFPVAIALSFAVHWARTASLAPVAALRAGLCDALQRACRKS